MQTSIKLVKEFQVVLNGSSIRSSMINQ